MKKLVTISIIVSLLIMIPSIFLKTGSFQDPEQKSKQERMYQITVGGKSLDVEVVSGPEEMKQGLSGRTEIGSDGMLFAFAFEQRPAFWMKDMLFDIDIIWINEDKVVDITRNVSKPKDYNAELTMYSPNQAVNYVLEVNAGDVDKMGISVGDTVNFE